MTRRHHYRYWGEDQIEVYDDRHASLGRVSPRRRNLPQLGLLERVLPQFGPLERVIAQIHALDTGTRPLAFTRSSLSCTPTTYRMEDERVGTFEVEVAEIESIHVARTLTIATHQTRYALYLYAIDNVFRFVEQARERSIHVTVGHDLAWLPTKLSTLVRGELPEARLRPPRRPS